MLFRSSLIKLFLLVSLLAGCAHLKPNAQWQAAELPLKGVQHSLVLVLLGDSTTRKQYEAEWVLALRKQAINAGPSYAVVDTIEGLKGEALLPLNASHNVDSVLVASVSLVQNDPEALGKNLSEYIDHQLNMGFDVFMQQMESVPLQMSAFSLHDQTLLWRTEYNVKVVGQGLDWDSVVPSSVSMLMDAGLSPPPEPEKAKGDTEKDNKSSTKTKEPAPLKYKP